jgi:hypothetical protein
LQSSKKGAKHDSKNANLGLSNQALVRRVPRKGIRNPPDGKIQALERINTVEPQVRRKLP